MIDPILRDRIINIKTKALSKNEKLIISKDYIMPEILKQVGYAKNDILINDELLVYIIENFTYEAGVRKLKEKLFSIVWEKNLENITENNLRLPCHIDKEIIDSVFKEYNKVQLRKIPKSPQVGWVNGLFATSAGTGGITVIQTYKIPTEQKLGLELTGQQGDVMKESMKVAKTVAWNLIPAYVQNKIKREWSEGGNWGCHIHCPEGATPKDGPSAGAAITIAILSLLTNIKVDNKIAMTGEMDLNGNVLPIGGLEAKTDGAKKAGASLVLCPKKNEEDLVKIRNGKFPPEDETFKIKMVTNIFDVIKEILVFDENGPEMKFNVITCEEYQ